MTHLLRRFCFLQINYGFLLRTVLINVQLIIKKLNQKR